MSQTYAIPKQQLIQMLHRDVRLMLTVYIGRMDLEIPAMHEEIWGEFLDLLQKTQDPSFVTDKLKKLLAIPREHAKTTLVKLAVILFMRYSPLAFTAYVSNTAPVAMNAIRDIKDFILSDMDKELFGESTLVRSSEQENIFVIDLAVPDQVGKKRIILKAFGQGTQLRGFIYNNQRPDLLVFDDIESEATVSTKEQQMKLDSWAMGSAIKAMGRRGIVIFIGNMLRDTSLLARLSKSAEWNPTVLGSLVRNQAGEITPLWPGRWTLEGLLEDYWSFVKIGLGHVWEAEMMNLTTESIMGESLAHVELLPMPLPDEIEAGFLTLDPAFGENAWNDFSAVTVHVRRKSTQPDGKPNPPEAVMQIVKKADNAELFDDMLLLSDYWGINTWFIEAVAAQRLLFNLFTMYLAERQLMPDTLLMLPVPTTRDSKASRILEFRSAVSKGSYVMCQGLEDLREKLQMYTPLSKEKDDDLDSAAMGLMCWHSAGTVINSRGTVGISGAIIGAYDTSPAVSPTAYSIP